jgi:hypothetical protein
MKVTGILSISNGTGLVYPFPLVVASLMRMCDNVIVGVDPNFPEDRKTLETFDAEPDGLQLVDAPWDLTNRNGGTEIAIKMDELTSLASEQESDWVVVMQADELFHDDDFPMLQAFRERYNDSYCNGFSTERVYYWKDLKHIRVDWNARLVRVFKPGTYSFMAEGTSKDGMFSGQTIAGDEIALSYKIHHYSRVDPDPMLISKRVRNLDTFFHPDEVLIPEDSLPAYDFKPRSHDNFSTDQPPQHVLGNIKKYDGPHPLGIEDWYNV